jgi:hypothetical protein
MSASIQIGSIFYDQHARPFVGRDRQRTHRAQQGVVYDALLPHAFDEFPFPIKRSDDISDDFDAQQAIGPQVLDVLHGCCLPIGTEPLIGTVPYGKRQLSNGCNDSEKSLDGLSGPASTRDLLSSLAGPSAEVRDHRPSQPATSMCPSANTCAPMVQRAPNRIVSVMASASSAQAVKNIQFMELCLFGGVGALSCVVTSEIGASSNRKSGRHTCREGTPLSLRRNSPLFARFCGLPIRLLTWPRSVARTNAPRSDGWPANMSRQRPCSQRSSSRCSNADSASFQISARDGAARSPNLSLAASLAGSAPIRTDRPLGDVGLGRRQSNLRSAA